MPYKVINKTHIQKMPEMEEWRDIPGYEGIYQVSSIGRVKSLPKMVGHNWGGLKNGRRKYLRDG